MQTVLVSLAVRWNSRCANDTMTSTGPMCLLNLLHTSQVGAVGIRRALVSWLCSGPTA